MKFTRPVTTRIEDFDHHGCTKPEAILSYLENAADRHSASVSDDTIRKSLGGTAWILTQWRVEVITPPTWQDSLFVETWVVDKGASVRSHRQFLLKHADGTILVRAEATLALLDLASRKVRRISEALVKCYHAEDEAVFAGELPDLKGRESILRLHAKKVKLGPDCDFGVVARMTPGASGAELANIVNEAALCAVRHHRKAVTQFDLQEAVDTILAGAQKKNKILNNKEKCIVSYHEVGHALVAALQTNSAPVQKITIVPRTSGALGFTMQVEDGDHTLMTKEEILNKIATLTGGRAAEELIFHSITTGASNDIEQATKLARALVTRYGMSEDFDMVALETVNNAYLGGDASLACSEQTAAQVDAKVVEIVQAEHKKAYQLLADNKRKLDEIAQYLYEKETISGEEFMRILNAQPQLPAGPSADSTNQAQ